MTTPKPTLGKAVEDAMDRLHSTSEIQAVARDAMTHGTGFARVVMDDDMQAVAVTRVAVGRVKL